MSFFYLLLLYKESDSLLQSPADTSSESVNIEMLLENYITQLEWIEAEVDDLIDEIRNTEGKNRYFS